MIIWSALLIGVILGLVSASPLLWALVSVRAPKHKGNADKRESGDAASHDAGKATHSAGEASPIIARGLVALLLSVGIGSVGIGCLYLLAYDCFVQASTVEVLTFLVISFCFGVHTWQELGG